MNRNRVTVVTRSLTSLPSRRDVLRGLASAGLGLGAARQSVTAVAKKQGKKKRKRAKPNAYGCLNVGDPCKYAALCCSGICEGKKCRAHDTCTCAAGKHPASCAEGSNVACTTNLGKPGICGTTSGNAGYCLAAGECFACATDTECQAAKGGKYGPRAACLRCADECAGTGGTACVGPDTIVVPV